MEKSLKELLEELFEESLKKLPQESSIELIKKYVEENWKDALGTNQVKVPPQNQKHTYTDERNPERVFQKV